MQRLSDHFIVIVSHIFCINIISLLLSVVCLQAYVPIYSIKLLHKFMKEWFFFRFLLFVVWFCFISFRCVLIIFQTNAVTMISIRLEFPLSQTFLGGKQRKRHGLNLVLLVSKRTTIQASMYCNKIRFEILFFSHIFYFVFLFMQMSLFVYVFIVNAFLI